MFALYPTLGCLPAGGAASPADAADPDQLPVAFGERPLLVLFMLPIICCALLGPAAWPALHPGQRPGHHLFMLPRQ